MSFGHRAARVVQSFFTHDAPFSITISVPCFVRHEFYEKSKETKIIDERLLVCLTTKRKNCCSIVRDLLRDHRLIIVILYCSLLLVIYTPLQLVIAYLSSYRVNLLRLIIIGKSLAPSRVTGNAIATYVCTIIRTCNCLSVFSSFSLFSSSFHVASSNVYPIDDDLMQFWNSSRR